MQFSKTTTALKYACLGLLLSCKTVQAATYNVAFDGPNFDLTGVIEVNTTGTFTAVAFDDVVTSFSITASKNGSAVRIFSDSTSSFGALYDNQGQSTSITVTPSEIQINSTGSRFSNGNYPLDLRFLTTNSSTVGTAAALALSSLNELGYIIFGSSTNTEQVGPAPFILATVSENTQPTATSDSYTTNEDVPASGNVVSDDTGNGADSDPENDTLTASVVTEVQHGTLSLSGNGFFTYESTQDYCGQDSFTYKVNDGVLDSDNATVSLTVTCVNDAPVAVDNSYSGDEDTQQSGNVIVNNTGEGVDFDVDGDGMTIFSNTDVAHGTLGLNPDGSFTYDPNLNYCGPDSFDYVITDAPSAISPSLTSNTATISLTVKCVNDPPTVASVVPGAQTSDYSDNIGVVVVTVNDVDNVSTTLNESNEPPFSAAGLDLTSTGCSMIDTESPGEDGSDCTWSYSGQVLDPGDNMHDILFTASDGDGAGLLTGTHTLSIVPEEATVVLDSGNDVAVQVVENGGDSGEFSLYFSAKEMNNPDNPHAGTARFGDLNEMVPFMTLVPVGPGGPISADGCGFIAPLPEYPGDGYGQVAMFECAFSAVPVNTYVVEALVDGASDTTIYYTGTDDAVLVVFDPSLGFTTGGGWFYWPGTDDPALLACGEDGYLGDKTNFGFNMKYNKKRTNIQGSLLMMRHTVDANCEGAGKYRVKSNALDGLSIGDGTDDDGDYGWAAFSGKSVFAGPGIESEGNHPFLIYVEDHGDEGGNQGPADEFWIQVKDKDGIVVLETNGPDSDPAGPDSTTDGDDVSIENGNVIVPRNKKGGGKR